MILMQMKQVSKSFAGKVLLQNIHIDIKNNDKIAIVGRNGAGKSTILKTMTGEIGYDNGEITTAKNIEIGYLSQHNDLASGATIWDEMLSVFAHLMIEEQELEEISARIEAQSVTDDYDEQLVLEYSNRQEAFVENGGYRFRSDVKGVLKGLGFGDSAWQTKVNDLSGGQKTRLALGKLLLSSPDLLILDEPTNHLDISTLAWLENYLTNYDGAIVIVSHDRYFLDKVVHTVYEVANKQTKKFHGTYTNFLKLRAANYEQDLKLYEKQQKEIKDAETFIAKNIARASTSKRAQSKRKQLEKMVVLDKPFTDHAQATFQFQTKKTSGNDVLKVRDFTYTHPGMEQPLFAGISFHINRGDRIALIGENGIGKTTLLKAILHTHAEIDLGTNVEIGYYAQEQEQLHPKHTILEEVWDNFPDKNEQHIRQVLGNFLFTDDEVLKQIQDLSGGEKARVALAKLMLKKANFLILDEPTNHLDVMSREVLENALMKFAGTIFFVSHDRYFINKLADEIVELTADRASIYLGDYDYYLEKKAEEAEILALEEDTPKTVTSTKSTQQLTFSEQKKQQSEARKIKREIVQLEESIELMEEELRGLEEKMTAPEIIQDHEQLMALSQEAEELRLQIETAMDEWANLQT